MNLVLIGLSHKTAPVEVRERVAFPQPLLPTALEGLRADAGAKESLILSTCNRVEILARTDSDPSAPGRIQDFLHRHHSLQNAFLNDFLYSLRDVQVVRHIFRVASSLDSMVIGEPQILGQLKQAYALSRAGGHLGPALGKLLPRAFFVAKRIRTETAVGNASVSVGSVAVDLAQRIFGSMKGKAALLVGAGKMAELAASHLIRSGITRVNVANRSLEAAQRLAQRLQGTPIPYQDLEAALVRSDVVLVSTSAEHFILDRSRIEAIIRRRKYRPLFMIDISVPRNIDPAAHEIENVFLFDIDDLQEVVESNRAERRERAQAAEEIVEEEVRKYLNRRASDQIGPMVQAVRRHFEDVCLDGLPDQIRSLEPNESERLERHLKKTAHRLAHPFIVELKKSNSPDSPELDLIKRIFGIEDME